MRHAMKPVILVLVLAVGAFLASPGSASTKLAFVVGIDRYDNLAPDRQLQKAVNDARAVDETLSALGFEVTRVEDAGRIELVRQWQRFLNRLEPGDTAAFFFAGHGVELDGPNYLLPRDVPEVVPGEKELLKAAALPLNGFLSQLRERRVQISLAIVDACRDNPFTDARGRSLGGTRGLGRIEAPEGSFVMFSAATGQTALDRLGTDDPDPNSVFTRSLVRHLATPELELADIAREVRREVRSLARSVGHDQRPAYYDEVIGRFCPAGCVAPEGEASADLAAGAWLNTQDTTSEEKKEKLLVEINQLTQAGPNCVVSVIFANRLDVTVVELAIEVVVFDESGRFSAGDMWLLPFKGITPKRVVAHRFYFPEKACTDVDYIMLNKVVNCEGDGLDLEYCSKVLGVESRTDVIFAPLGEGEAPEELAAGAWFNTDDTTSEGEQKKLLLEVNKLTQMGPNCGASLIFANRLDVTVVEFATEVVVFDDTARFGAGDVWQVPFDAIPPGRGVARQVQFPAKACEDIDYIMLNKVVSCEGDGLDPEYCSKVLGVESRADMIFASPYDRKD